jgi:hypothetical protein
MIFSDDILTDWTMIILTYANVSVLSVLLNFTNLCRPWFQNPKEEGEGPGSSWTN